MKFFYFCLHQDRFIFTFGILYDFVFFLAMFCNQSFLKLQPTIFLVLITKQYKETILDSIFEFNISNFIRQTSLHHAFFSLLHQLRNVVPTPFDNLFWECTSGRRKVFFLLLTFLFYFLEQTNHAGRFQGR